MSRLIRFSLLVLAAAACSPSAGESSAVVRVEGSAAVVTAAPVESTTSTTLGPTTTTTPPPGVVASGCGAPGPEHVVLFRDPPVPGSESCSVGTYQQLRFFNLSDSELVVEWAGESVTIAAGESVRSPKSVGDVLGVGSHQLDASPLAAPELRVPDPDGGFGVAEVGLRTFGGLRPGATLSEAEEDLGRSITVQQRTTETPCTIGWVTDDPYSPLITLVGPGLDPRITRVEATVQGQRTFSGVGLGSSLAEVSAAYGDQLLVTERAAGSVLVFEPNDSADANFRLLFETTGNRVTAMRIGRIGEVEKADGCG